MLLHVFLRETEVLALADVQVDLVSDVRDDRGALVKLLAYQLRS